MKNINDVLKQKEIEYLQLQKEIDSLRVAARLLADEPDAPAYAAKPIGATAAAPLSQMRASAAPPVGAAGESGYSSSWDAAPKKFP
jgi:hypothetical protein